MKFKQGDIVRFTSTGQVDWEVVGPAPQWFKGVYMLKSGMTGNRRTASEHEIKPWVPHE